ncbi:hypothetical protein B0H63DRAFT_564325 [Podospora didyma]|uniref:Uncharacterized protein n=1 Tax=Podospora didyma TaxID=330526 RepID=A0AAE0K622_9PEZI|nr:hypothetical protein B0H63DRAFT_564325 [Podospora didyma]
MHFPTTFASLALLASAVLAAPAVADRDVALITPEIAVPESIKAATDLGIDVWGKLPDDAVKVGDHWEAEVGTLANAWLRAQVDLDNYEAALEAANATTHIERRQASGWANIGFTLWTQDGCSGQAAWWDNVQYGWSNYVTTNYYGLAIRYRGLRSGERLELRRVSGSDWCGSYWGVINGPTGTSCYNLAATNCLRLYG